MSELRSIQQALVGIAYERRDRELADLADRMNAALSAEAASPAEAELGPGNTPENSLGASA